MITNSPLNLVFVKLNRLIYLSLSLKDIPCPLVDLLWSPLCRLMVDSKVHTTSVTTAPLLIQRQHSFTLRNLAVDRRHWPFDSSPDWKFTFSRLFTITLDFFFFLESLYTYGQDPNTTNVYTGSWSEPGDPKHSYAQSETGLIWQELCATEKLISLKKGHM